MWENDAPLYGTSTSWCLYLAPALESVKLQAVLLVELNIISGFGFDKLHQTLSTIAAHHDGSNVKKQRYARSIDRNQHKDSFKSSHSFLHRWRSYLQSSLFGDS